ncbi:MAG: Mur ligase family protein [Candidatus Latescibacterota bacterium]
MTARSRRPADLAQRAWHGLKIGMALSYRRLLPHVGFVGVTGSCGKTTTKELIGAILSSRGAGCTSNQATNEPHRVASTVLAVRPWHRYCVHELGGFGPGVLGRSAVVLRPAVGVVTRVAFDHYTAYRGLEATAREKSSLVRALPAGGTAVLNADDPRVLAMAACTAARVITYGLSPEAMVRGEDASCAWPEPLSLTVAHGETRVRVQTQLLGEHWVHAVLAALTAGVAMGVPLPQAVVAVSRVPPVRGRMSPHPMTDGVTFIDDTWKAPLYSVPVALRFLATARARRRIAVFGTISDSPGSCAKRYRKATRQALTVADAVFCVGPWADSAVRVHGAPGPERLRAFGDLHALRAFLREFLAPGDLVLLKGSCGADHLERLVLGWEQDFACWRRDCGRTAYCTDCRLRHRPWVPDP